MKDILRSFKFYFFVSLITMLVVGYWRFLIINTYGSDTYPEYGAFREEGFTLVLSMSLFSSFLLALFSSLVDKFFFKYFLHRKSLGFVLVSSTLIQLIFINLIIYVSGHFLSFHFLEGTILPRNNFYQIPDLKMLVLTMFFIIAVSRLLLEIDQKLGRGNLWKLITGKFYSPREERRIFMFIDLKYSTTIAEEIGHYMFSCLIQDCFRDLSVIQKYNAEVYQYVGDEVVISWDAKSGLEKNNYLKAFYAFKDVLESRRQYYEKSYGLFPYFKAGANLGLCTVTEVGELKRDICYHGDTLNTASRIEGLCNFYKAELLISEYLVRESEFKNEFTIEESGCVELRGKSKKVGLYKVALNGQ